MAELTRCAWAGSDPLMRAYHDEEWGVPEHDPRALWEKLMLDGFQAGLAWITVLRKRDAFRAAFKDFDPDKVAKFKERDIERLLGDAGIIRSRAKIESTIRGAQIFTEMRDSGEDFADFCWSFTDGKVLRGDGIELPAKTPLSEEVSKELKRRGFKFVGPTIVYAWMQAVGIVNDHSVDCFRRGQV
jgi:DNA-3-methyladenine glycosylase I